MSQTNVKFDEISMYYVQILVCIMCRFEDALCADFSTSYVYIHAGARCARLARFARYTRSECLTIVSGDTFRGTELMGRFH